MSYDHRKLRRPLDEAHWPEKLAARVVAPGPRPAIHGYDVEEDLARHYSFAEMMLLALTAQIPSAEQGKAFEVALQFVCPCTVNEAPTHAAILARVCAGTTSSIQGTAAIALAEQARVRIAEHRSWIEALSGPIAGVDDAHRPSNDDERASVDRLRRAIRGTFAVPALSHDVGRFAAILAVFYECGLRQAEQMECALVLARLPVAVAEALATPAAGYRDYPVHLPPIEYVGPGT
jgi:hypothetical protein